MLWWWVAGEGGSGRFGRACEIVGLVVGVMQARCYKEMLVT